MTLRLILCLLLSGLLRVSAEEKQSSFLDPEDGWFDISSFLERKAGFYPLAAPITEPAVGYGAAVVPLFIRQPDDGSGRPDLWGAGAMRTNNGSEGIFAGYSGYFDEQRYHVLAGAASMSVNLEFHGLGSDIIEDGPLLYNLDLAGGLVGVDRRIGDSDWRIGLRYLYADVTAGLADEQRARAESADFVSRFGEGFKSTVSSIQGAVQYDTRDNIFTPTRGLFSELSLMVNDEALGGTTDYQIVNWATLWFQPVVKDRLFLGVKAECSQTFGDVPFYHRPFVQLRGAPIMRYQGEGVAFTEAELRWQFHRRWSLLGFGGAGFTWTGEEPFQRTNSTFTGGAGFRYLIARRHGIHVGVDVAWGEEGEAIYIQFGNAWFRP